MTCLTRWVLAALLLAPVAVLTGCQTQEKGSPDGIPSNWKKTASGLKYWDVTEGTGEPVKAGDTVLVHYFGTLIHEDPKLNGLEFDNSRTNTVTKGAPFEVRGVGEGKVIKGWDEGLQGMKIGGKRKLEIPPNLAYGKTGAGKAIPPDTALHFEIDLIEIR